MIDTGYGIYHADVMRMFARYGLESEQQFRQIIVTHADADHCGAAGFFPIEILMHPGTLEIIRQNNRAYGSRSEHSLLEAFYTRMINLFSQFRPPQQTRCLLPSGEPPCSIFPTLGTLRIGDLDLTVLEGLGGAYLRADLPVLRFPRAALHGRQRDQFFESHTGTGKVQLAGRFPCHFRQCRQRSGPEGTQDAA